MQQTARTQNTGGGSALFQFTPRNIERRPVSIASTGLPMRRNTSRRIRTSRCSSECLTLISKENFFLSHGSNCVICIVFFMLNLKMQTSFFYHPGFFRLPVEEAGARCLIYFRISKLQSLIQLIVITECTNMIEAAFFYAIMPAMILLTIYFVL